MRVYLDAVQTGWIIGLSLTFGLILPLVLGYVMSWLLTKGLYFGWFVRTTPNKYPRETPSCAEESQVKMFTSGLSFKEQEKAFLSDVSIVSEGLTLQGLYLDYHRSISVIVIPGRSETSSYSFYYAELYKNSLYNVLLIDSRATGLSEGKFLTAGIKESSDLIAWAKFLHGSVRLAKARAKQNPRMRNRLKRKKTILLRNKRSNNELQRLRESVTFFMWWGGLTRNGGSEGLF